MSTYQSILPNARSFLESNREEKGKVLDLLFEPCPVLRELIIHELEHEYSQLNDLNTKNNNENSINPSKKSENYPSELNSYSTIINKVIRNKLYKLGTSAKESDQKDIVKILNAHPRLGAKKVESNQSQSEQKSLASSSKEEEDLLLKLNEEYEQTFPGLRYVVFVNGRSRGEIMKDMRNRIDRGNFEQEKILAIQAMCDIALSRANKLISGPNL